MAPAKRRRTGGPASSSAASAAQQSTLSFRSSKASAHRVAKPGVSSAHKGRAGAGVGAGKAAAAELEVAHGDREEDEQSPAAAHDDDDDETLDDAAMHHSAAQPAPQAHTAKAATQPAAEPASKAAAAEPETPDAEPEIFAAARRVTPAQIQRYWAAKERERKAPRVHQQDLSVRDKVLREFDMTGSYGPSIGLSRLARWKRAHALGLKPPVEVLSVLLAEEDRATKGKGGGKMGKSIMDELILSSRVRDEHAAEA